ncbi:hypothetical protein THIX_60504 [Thiomonas sp. X19]|uniref:hypothetical protein n=1 Tax=Thiomonas sp. X19 TaxID=1050370 RepID=UPI000B73EBB5|nr:hypothetical protein [Thiomonas sp. X19]SCC94446.1 hypothetical protein THIX_60504 [Thiomonas sp. X19]
METQITPTPEATGQKVALHVCPTMTRSGFWCRRWLTFKIVVGEDPLGPRGGHGGFWGSGRVVCSTTKPAEANDYLARYARLNGCKIV